jgi:hypothetical protein
MLLLPSDKHSDAVQTTRSELDPFVPKAGMSAAYILHLSFQLTDWKEATAANLPRWLTPLTVRVLTSLQSISGPVHWGMCVLQTPSVLTHVFEGHWLMPWPNQPLFVSIAREPDCVMLIIAWQSTLSTLFGFAVTCPTGDANDRQIRHVPWLTLVLLLLLSDQWNSQSSTCNSSRLIVDN